MKNRINISETEPAAIKAMYGLVSYLNGSKISKTHMELLKIRASQINGCAYCIDMHTKDALKNGETAQRIFLLNAWKEANLFSDEEKALLAVTEDVTLISQNGLSDETYQKAATFFDENYISQLIMAVITINAWNRIAISCQTKIPQ